MESAEKGFEHGLTEVMNLAIMDLEGKDKGGTSELQEQVNNTAKINALKLEIKTTYPITEWKKFKYTYGQSRGGGRFNSQNRQPRRNNRFEKAIFWYQEFF